MKTNGVLILLSSLIALVIIVKLIVHHRTKVQTKRIEKENDRAALEKIIGIINDEPKHESTSISSAQTAQNDQVQRIKMKCQKCGGSTELDASRNILFCPYCSSKELIIESDYLKEARIKASMNEKIAEEKRLTANELYNKYNDSIKIHGREERKDKAHKTLRIIASTIIAAIAGLFMLWGFFYLLLYELPSWLKNR